MVTGDVTVAPNPTEPPEPPEPQSKEYRKTYESEDESMGESEDESMGESEDESMGTMGDFLLLKELFSQNPKTASNAASLARHHQQHSNVPQIIACGEKWLEKQRRKAQRVEK